MFAQVKALISHILINAQILLPLIINLTVLTVLFANCGGKKKGTSASGGPPSNDSKKQAQGEPPVSKADKPSEKKEVDVRVLSLITYHFKIIFQDGNYEELAVPQ